MDNVHNFAKLLCGVTRDDLFDLENVLKNLNKKIVFSTTKIINKMSDLEGDISAEIDDISYHARKVLESSMTALLGRMDPFRVIITYNVQKDSSYDLGKRAMAAIDWTGDIFSKDNVKAVWHFEKKKEQFDRAILGDYCGEIIWKPALKAFSDWIADKEYDSTWVDEVIAENEDVNFKKIKLNSNRLFSSLSKGVHSECLTDELSMIDKITLRELLIENFKICSILGLLSHFVGFAEPRLNKDDALNYFLSTEEMINNV